MTAAEGRDLHHLQRIDGGVCESVGVEEGWPPFAKSGLYHVAFVRCDRTYAWRAKKWRIDWRIVDEGPAFGIELPMFATRIASKDRLHPSRKLVLLFAIATDRRPPSHLWQLNPKQFLEGCVFTGKVETSKRDGAHGTDRPECLHYSVVATLTRRESGTPPILRGRERR